MSAYVRSTLASLLRLRCLPFFGPSEGVRESAVASPAVKASEVRGFRATELRRLIPCRNSVVDHRVYSRRFAQNPFSLSLSLPLGLALAVLPGAASLCPAACRCCELPARLDTVVARTCTYSS